jgi:hypothetical protein
MDYALGDLTEAREMLTRVLELTRQGQGNEFNAMTAHLGLGVIAEAKNNQATATEEFAGALNQFEILRADFALPDLTIEFVGSHTRLYARTARLLVEQKRTREAFRWIEHSKSRALLNLLAVTPLATAARGVKGTILGEEQNLLQRVQSLSSRTRTMQPDAKTLIELRYLNSQLDAVWRQMDDKEYVALRRGDPLTFGQMMDVLQVG